MGDDLHVEGPKYPTAVRGGTHDDFLDPIVLDLDGSLDGTPGSEPVHVDLEFGLPNPSGIPDSNCTGPDPALKFYDGGLNGFWDDGEDIILDVNGNGVFD